MAGKATGFLRQAGTCPGLMGRPGLSSGIGADRKWLFWLCGITAFRILYLYLFPEGLAGDEAYYWEWGRRPDWGYYSKPPLIGWQMAVVHWLGGNTPEWIRLPSVLYTSGFLAATYWLGRSLYNAQTGLTAMLLAALTPANTVQGLIATIDAPLLFFWAVALLSFWRLFYGGGGKGWAIVLVLCLGFGNLAKQMMLVFPLLGFAVLALDPGKRKYLSDWKLWGGWSVTLLFLFPPLYWNAQNDWITFQHTGEHFHRGNVTALKQAGRFLEFILAEAFIINPIVYFAGLAALCRVSRKLTFSPPQTRFLWLFSAPAILIFLLLATRQRVNPNWPAVFYLPMLVLLAGEIEQFRRKTLKKAALALGSTLAVFTYSLAFLILAWKLEGSSLDIFRKFRGYSEFGKLVHQARQSLPKPTSTDLVVLGHRYGLCQLAFNTPGQPQILAWNIPGEPIGSQYGIWPGVPQKPRKPALVIIQKDSPLPEDWPQRYKTLAKLPQTIDIRYHGKPLREYELYLGTPFTDDPSP